MVTVMGTETAMQPTALRQLASDLKSGTAMAKPLFRHGRLSRREPSGPNVPADCARRKTRPARQNLRVHEPVRVRTRRRCEGRRFRGNSKRREDWKSLQDFEPFIFVRGSEPRG